MSSIDKFDNRIYRPILPLVYTEALSYMEMLAKVGAKLNEVIDYIDGFKEQLQDLVDEAIAKYSVEVNKKLDDLKAYVDSQDNELMSYVNEYISREIASIKEELNNYEEKVNIRLANMDTKLIAMQGMIDNNLKYLISYVDAENLKQDKEAQEEYAKIRLEIANIERTYPPMFNPFMGTYTPVSDVVMDMYKYFRYFAFTCGDYEALELTAEQYDKAYLSAVDYDLYGRLFFDFFTKMLNIVNPFTGKRDKLSAIIGYLASKTSDYNITAENFDNLQLTAEQYEGYGLSAEGYDFAGNVTTGALKYNRLCDWSDGKVLYKLYDVRQVTEQTTVIDNVIPEGSTLVFSNVVITQDGNDFALNGENGEYEFSNGDLVVNFKNAPTEMIMLRINCLFSL